MVESLMPPGATPREIALSHGAQPNPVARRRPGAAPLIMPGRSSAAVPPAPRAAAPSPLVQLTNRVLGALNPAAARLAPFAIEAAQKTGVPASLLLAVTGQESAYGTNEGPSRGAGARGVAQFTPGTRAMMIQKYGVDPWANDKQGILASALYLKELGVQHDPQRALSAYSGGYSPSTYNNPILRNAQNFKGLDVLAARGGPGVAKLASGVGRGPYINPYSDRPRTEVDMGVDYSGTGPIGAIGKGHVVGESSFGGGPYVAYQLDKGPRKGWDVYVAEGVNPTVHVGDPVKKGQPIGVQTGAIETGWAGNPKVPYRGGAQTLAAATGDPRIATRHGTPGGAGDTGTPVASDPVAGRDFLKFISGKPSGLGGQLSSGLGGYAGMGDLGSVAAGLAGGVPGAGGGGVPSSPVQIQTVQLRPPNAASPIFPAGYVAPSSGSVTQQPSVSDLFAILTGAPAVPSTPGAPGVPGVPSVPGVRSRRRARYALPGR
jgi:transglycosylase-like protein with SLT domain